MGLRIVGTGLGRTGTKSLHTALGMLGFGPCHHMMEVFQHPESMQLWIDAGEGRPDWDAIFEHYHSAVDYPTAAYWRELTRYYPDAKVLHTVRDPDEWFQSVHTTIFAPDGLSRRDGEDAPARFFASLRRRLPSQLDDRAVMTQYFRSHTEAVIAAISAKRLLVYQVGEGWERLCRFLGVPVPSAPFPSENSRAEFIARMQAQPTGP
ncbi:MAG TPA: sulfotransferase [Steroidobacteraceae bacterium]|nr:sulfotransferase [Steroidobacteraceae bacterium]